MSISKTYDNVNRRRWACMKGLMRKRIEAFAKHNGYQISTWNTPDSSEAIWHIVLKSRNSLKPTMDFTARVSHNQKSQQVSVELIRMPGFISMEKAIAQLNSVYRSCKA